MSFLRRNTRIASDFPEYPIKALREALANALAHRDYHLPGGSVSIGIYQNRIEIWNYGFLPSDISIDAISEFQESIPRNPNILNILYYTKICESWGRGIQLIFDECIENGNPSPVFLEKAKGMCITIYSRSEIISPLSQIKVSMDLTALQKDIVDLLSKNTQLSIKEILSLLKQSSAESTVRENLRKLKAKGLIEKSGRAQHTVWTLKK